MIPVDIQDKLLYCGISYRVDADTGVASVTLDFDDDAQGHGYDVFDWLTGGVEPIE